MTRLKESLNMHPNHRKIEIKPTSFFNKVVQILCFISEVPEPFYAAVYVVMLNKKSSTLKRWLTMQDKHYLLLLHNNAYDNRGIAESLHEYIYRANYV